MDNYMNLCLELIALRGDAGMLDHFFNFETMPIGSNARSQSFRNLLKTMLVLSLLNNRIFLCPAGIPVSQLWGLLTDVIQAGVVPEGLKQAIWTTLIQSEDDISFIYPGYDPPLYLK